MERQKKQKLALWILAFALISLTIIAYIKHLIIGAIIGMMLGMAAGPIGMLIGEIVGMITQWALK